MDELLDFLSGHMSNENFTKGQGERIFFGLVAQIGALEIKYLFQKLK